jgi:DNA-binding GntR family transcriptional regulator
VSDPTSVLGSTLARRVAAILRQRILSAEVGYEPGRRLYAARIAQELGVSVTPVREALQLLAAGHLVELSPHRSVRVVQIAPDDFEDLLRVLSSLQALAVQFRSGPFSSHDITRLTRCLEACEAAMAVNDIETYRRHDEEFHRLIAVASGSPTLAGLYVYLSDQAATLEIYFPHEPEAIAVSLAEHWDLLHDLAEGDVARSVLAMEEHNKRSRERARRAYLRLVGAGAGESPDGEPPRASSRGSRA